MSEKEKKEVEDLEVLEDDAEVFEDLESVVSTVATKYKTVKAYGGKGVRLGTLTAGQMITFLENNEKPAERRKNGLVLIALSMVDKKGKRLVDPRNEEAIKAAVEKLKDQDSVMNGKLVQIILELNGMQKKDAEKIAKNDSGGTPTGVSPTA